MLSRWWCPWLLPVMMLGGVLLVSRPELLGAWLALCLLIGRGINAAVAELTGRTAPGTYLYFKNPS